MRHPEPLGEWCRRLEEAVLDGRLGEDPALWSHHYERCDRCRATVEGYLILRRLVEMSRTPTPPAAPSHQGPVLEPPASLLAAFDRARRRRQRQRASLATLAILLLAVGAWALLRSGQGPAEAPAEAPPEAIVYARQLFDRLNPPGAPSQVMRLSREPELEREYLAALRHPSSVVRRIAFMQLAQASRPVPAEETRRLLAEAQPTLERPVELAAAGDVARQVGEALERGRANLLRSVLEGLRLAPDDPAARVPASVLLPYVADPDARVREAALLALGRDPTFKPGVEVQRLLASDPEPVVRREAAGLIASRGGEAGRAFLVEHFSTRSDPEVEAWAADVLGDGPAAKALSRRRLADATCPTGLALAHALHLVRAGEPVDPDRSLDRWLASGDEDAAMLSYVASEAGWDRHRPRLQERWRAARGQGRQGMGASLARWDAGSKDPSRRPWLFEILEDGRNPALRDVLQSLQEHADPEVRARADEIARRWAASR